jgi:restriction system protein
MAQNSEQTVWGIHAGKSGDADSLFLKNEVIALGWSEMGDLSKLPNNREPFKAMYSKTYPDVKQGSIPVNAGQLFRFVHEIQIGDIVVYPSKIDKRIHVGKVKSTYIYQPQVNSNYPHVRRVEWLKDLSRTGFSQGALYEIGSAITLFQVQNYPDEFLRAITTKVTIVTPEIDDKIVASASDDIEQTTHDYILKRLAQDLKGKPFEYFVAHLLEKMGYRARVSGEGTDGGVDIIAHKDDLGFEPPIIKVQVKSVQDAIGAPEVQALYGNVAANEFGLFVTLSSFKHPARNFARSKSNLRLIGGEELVQLVLQYYDAFDARYKGIIPLKRVYIPQPIEESDLS